MLARFELLASALAGRPLAVTTAAPDELTHTDGRTIYVASALGHERSAVLVHAALLGAGSLAPAVVQRLRPRLVPRYLALEVRRALAAHAPVPAVGLLLPCDDVALPASAEESLWRAASAEEVPEPPPLWGTIRPRLLLATDVFSASRRVQAGAAGTDDRRATTAAGESDADDEAKVTSLGRPGGADAEGGLARFLGRLYRSGREEGGGRVGGRARRATAASIGRGSLFALRTTDLPPVEAAPRSGGLLYPEWDVGAMRYRPQWCHVRQLEPAQDASVVLSMPRPDHLLRQRLGPLALSLARTRRQADGDDIDVDALVESLVLQQATGEADERVYLSLVRRRRDLGVAVLLDVSGSTAETGDGVGRTHDRQTTLVAALLETLSALGDRVAAYAFRSHGRTAVDILHVKGFDEPFDASTLRRLQALEPAGFTRLGAAIRHATRLLERGAGTSHRVLVVVSDGFAYDHGYQGPYAQADARRALREAREGGIGCLCLTVGGSTDDGALRRVFGSAAYARSDSPTQMRDRMGALFQSALTNSEARALTIRRQHAHWGGA